MNSLLIQTFEADADRLRLNNELDPSRQREEMERERERKDELVGERKRGRERAKRRYKVFAKSAMHRSACQRRFTSNRAYCNCNAQSAISRTI